MSILPDIYKRLRTIPDASVDRAMAAALPTADPKEARLITLSLLERRNPEGVVAVVLYYDRLPADLQETVVKQAHQWYRPLREAASHPSPDAPANVIRVIATARVVKLAYLVAEQLHHRPEPIRAQAAEALLDLARWVGAPAPNDADTPACDAQSAKYLQAGIEEAVQHYDTHCQPTTLLALAALAPRAVTAALKHLSNPHHPAVAPMQTLLATAQHPDLHRAMLVMIQVPPLAKSVLKGLPVALEAGGLAEVLSGAHLLLNPRAAGPLQRLAQPDTLWPDADQIAKWPPRLTRALVRWAVSLPFSKDQQVAKLSELGKAADDLTRLLALRQLVAVCDGRDDHLTNEAIARYCFDVQQTVAWAALRHLIGVDWERLPHMLTRLINSQHEEVSGLARQRLAPMAFGRLWDGWPRMTPKQRLDIGRALIKIDNTFHSHLAEKLASPAKRDRLRAMSMIHTLNQGALFEKAMLTFAADRDEKIAASAVRALGSAQSQRAVTAVEGTLNHTDSRVRANAVEALGQLQSTRHLRELVKMAKEDQGRPRANAIQAIMGLNTGAAFTALDSMLNDPHPAQRISALWVVEAMGLFELARHVAEMAVADPDGQVKQRADRVIHELIHAMDPREPLAVNTQPGATKKAG